MQLVSGVMLSCGDGKRVKSLIFSCLTALAILLFASNSAASAQDESDADLAQIAPIDIEDAQSRVFEDSSLQAEFEEFEVPEIRERKPNWFTRFLDDVFGFLGNLGVLFKAIFWIGLAAIVGFILYYIATEFIGLDLSRRKKQKDEAAPDIGYIPEEAMARTLLEDADELARLGKYEDAARLLLTRSIQDIEDKRPGKIHASSTSREIAVMPAIPANARPAFSKIAGIVERAVFAERGLNKTGYEDARHAYESFALQGQWT